MRTRSVSIGLSMALVVASVTCGNDSPQWRGENHAGKFDETSLLKQWPAGGPKLLWKANGLGGGFSSPAVTKDMVFVNGMVGKQGVLFAFDRDGKPMWKQPYGPEWTGQHSGTRGTPVVDDGLVYVVSGVGSIACFDAKTGEKKWSVPALKRFGGKILQWGIAETPLVVDDKVICTPGGPNASIVALNKKTGERVWQTKQLSQNSGYCSPILIQRGERRLLVQMVADYVVALNPDDGKVVWKHAHKTRYDCQANSPVYEDGKMFLVSGYRTGGQMLALAPDGSKVRRLWIDKKMDTHHGGAVWVDGHVYGTSSRGRWTCLDATNGRPTYQEKGVGKGSVVFADGMLYCYGERGMLALARPNPKKFDMVSSFRITEGSGPHWAHPVIAAGRMYIRHGDVLLVYDIKRD